MEVYNVLTILERVEGAQVGGRRLQESLKIFFLWKIIKSRSVKGKKKEIWYP